MTDKLQLYIVGLLVVWGALNVVRDQPDDLLHLTMCDVGQGDAIFISFKNFQMLVDGGRDSRASHCVSKYMPFWDRQLELIVATHPDADHIAGLTEVIASYRVKTLLMTSESKQTADFERFKQAVQTEIDHGMSVLPAYQGMTILLPSPVTLKILSPLVEQRESKSTSLQNSETQLSDAEGVKMSHNFSANDLSIVLLLQYINVDILLTGDLERNGEQALLTNGLIKKVEILKVGHHGAKTSTTQAFLAKTRPEISLVSVGKNNRYRHPSPQVIQNLEDFHSKVLRTDISGTVKLSTDGEKIWLNSQ